MSANPFINNTVVVTSKRSNRVLTPDSDDEEMGFTGLGVVGHHRFPGL